MNPKKKYQKKVENFINETLIKYSRRQTIFEPISKILPNYWNDIFLRAAKNVLFHKVKPQNFTSYIWLVRHSVYDTYELAKMIIKEEYRLRELIYNKNRWKLTDPLVKTKIKNRDKIDEIVDKYNNIEMQLHEIKKLIDKL